MHLYVTCASECNTCIAQHTLQAYADGMCSFRHDLRDLRDLRNLRSLHDLRDLRDVRQNLAACGAPYITQ